MMESVLDLPLPAICNDPPLTVSFENRVRFTRAGFRVLAEKGIIKEHAAFELLNGELVPMFPIGTWHLSVTDKLNHLFATRLGSRVVCRNQGSQATSDVSEPIPDYQLLEPDADFYRWSHPTPNQVLLVVEVADSSLARDLGPKMQIYAAAGIVECWVIDLVNRRVAVHTDPDTAAAMYRSVVFFGDTEQVAPRCADDCTIDLAWLFGPRTSEAGA